MLMMGTSLGAGNWEVHLQWWMGEGMIRVCIDTITQTTSPALGGRGRISLRVKLKRTAAAHHHAVKAGRQSGTCSKNRAVYLLSTHSKNSSEL